MKKFFVLLTFLAATLVISAAPQDKPSEADPTCSLTATPSVIAPGSQVTLRWETTKARTVRINGTYRSAKGSMIVKPLAKTKYNLLAVSTTNRRCEQSVAILMTGDAPPAPPVETGLTGNLKHAFWTGGHGEDNQSDQAQWWVENILNVTPTTKRPQISTTMGGGAQDMLAAQLIASGIKGMTGIGGPLVTYYPGVNSPPVGQLDAGGQPWKVENHELWASDIKPFIDSAPARGHKYMYVDEPWSSCYGYTYEQRGSAGEVACTVRFWNAVRAKWKAAVPDGKFGLSLAEGDGHGRTLELLRGGLQVDFAALESYNSSNKYQDIFGAIHTEFPAVEKIALQDQTIAVCQLFDTYFTPANVTNPPEYPITVGYWNVNNFIGYRGAGWDDMFLANAQEHAQTGHREFCKQPAATLWAINGTQPANGWNADIIASTYNNLTVWYPQTGITWDKCEYRTMSVPANGLRVHMPTIQATAVETKPWTQIPCNGDNPLYPDATFKPNPASGTPLKMTVGPGADCRHNGQFACQLHLRATNSLGKVGRSISSWHINHSGLSGYIP